MVEYHHNLWRSWIRGLCSLACRHACWFICWYQFLQAYAMPKKTIVQNDLTQSLKISSHEVRMRLCMTVWAYWYAVSVMPSPLAAIWWGAFWLNITLKIRKSLTFAVLRFKVLGRNPARWNTKAKMMRPCEFRNRDDLNVYRHDQITKTENSHSIYFFFLKYAWEMCIITCIYTLKYRGTGSWQQHFQYRVRGDA